MPTILLTLLLSLQICFSAFTAYSPSVARRPAAAALPQSEMPEAQRLWWGMLDPELSLWYAHIPGFDNNPARPLQWSWSFEGFLAALFNQPLLKEVGSDAPCI